MNLAISSTVKLIYYDCYFMVNKDEYILLTKVVITTNLKELFNVLKLVVILFLSKKCFKNNFVSAKLREDRIDLIDPKFRELT